MATVSASLKMFDMMTKPLQQVTQALNLTISTMDQMANAANQNINMPNSLNAARAAAQRAGAALQELANEQDKAANAQNRLNNSLNNGVNSSGGLLNKVKGLVGAYIGVQALKTGIDATDNYTNQSARLALINDGLQTQEQLQQKIYQAAQRSRGAYGETVSSVAKLGLLAKDAFSNNNETIAFAELMNKSFRISGASMSEATNGMYQLTQAMAAGRLQGDEFRSVMENAPMLAQAIAKYTGKSMGELREMSSEGKITADIIKNSLFSAADDINAKFQTMPMTFETAWTRIKNQAVMTFSTIMQKVNTFLNSNNGAIFINNISNSITILAVALGWVIDGIIAVSTFFNNNWSMIAPIIWGIIAALIVYNASLIITNTLNGEGAIAMAAKTIASWAETAAIIALIIAQDGLNAALAACPITWIIMAVIILIAVFYAGVAAVNHFAGTSISATGIIAGVFAFLGAHIYNVVAYMWNVFAAYVEFLSNVFNNPVYSVKKLFANLAINVIDMCIAMTKGFDSFATNLANAMIDGINLALQAWNSFVDALNSFGGLGDKLGLGKAGTISHTSSITSSMESAKANINSWVGEAPSGYVSVPRMQQINLGGAFNAGYNWGKGVEEKFDISKILGTNGIPKGLGNFGNFSDLGNFGNGSGGGGGLGDSGKDANKHLKNIDDKIDVNNEHLEMLRDLAEQESIQNFVTLTPTVQVTTGDIKEEADIDKIIAKIETYMESELANSAEGVYT